MVFRTWRLDEESEGTDRCLLTTSKEERHIYNVLTNFLEQIMKMEYIKLSDEIETYKKHLAEMTSVERIIMSKSKYFNISWLS